MDRMIETNGAEIRIVETGDGEPALVFLHYWGGSARTWSRVTARAEHKARCICLDQRGWGASSARDGSYAPTAMADDVETVVAATGVTRFVLVGHSMGGKIAQILGARGMRGLVGMVLVAPAPPVPMEVPKEGRVAMMASYGSQAGVEGALSVLSHAPLSDEDRHAVVEDTLRGSPEAKRTWTETGMVESLDEAVRSIDVPVTIVVGDQDRVEAVARLRGIYASWLPAAEFRVLPGIGHLSPLEAPDAIAQACSDLLGAVAAREAGAHAASQRGNGEAVP